MHLLRWIEAFLNYFVFCARYKITVALSLLPEETKGWLLISGTELLLYSETLMCEASAEAEC